MKIGFIAGAFDLLHPGHLHIFAEAKELCDYLVVALHVDPSLEREQKNKPVQTVYERFKQLQACRYVDKIIPYENESDLLNILKMEKLDVRFLGDEYRYLTNPQRNEKITGRDLIPIEYIDRKHSFSSTELRERLKDATNA